VVRPDPSHTLILFTPHHTTEKKEKPASDGDYGRHPHRPGPARARGHGIWAQAAGAAPQQATRRRRRAADQTHQPRGPGSPARGAGARAAVAARGRGRRGGAARGGRAARRSPARGGDVPGAAVRVRGGRRGRAPVPHGGGGRRRGRPPARAPAAPAPARVSRGGAAAAHALLPARARRARPAPPRRPAVLLRGGQAAAAARVPRVAGPAGARRPLHGAPLPRALRLRRGGEHAAQGGLPPGRHGPPRRRAVRLPRVLLLRAGHAHRAALRGLRRVRGQQAAAARHAPPRGRQVPHHSRQLRRVHAAPEAVGAVARQVGG
jgi:hypothetical protein